MMLANFIGAKVFSGKKKRIFSNKSGVIFFKKSKLIDVNVIKDWKKILN